MSQRCAAAIDLRRVAGVLTLTFACTGAGGSVRAESLRGATPLVPGRGVKIVIVGDDFEDEDWRYNYHGEKASADIDKEVREPIGISNNERLFESTYRGHPDIVRRVATPAGGLPGSRGALLLRSRVTGAPHHVSGKQQQDDLMVNVYGVLGKEISPQNSPSCTVRVYLPPWSQWEQRSGSSFGFRIDCEAHGNAPVEGLLMTRRKRGWHQYWPGMFLVLRRQEDGYERTHAQVLLRAGRDGEDIEGPALYETGWHTLGMSITPNGEVHYFLHRGVEDLTADDHIASQFPYGLACENFNLVFFNIVNNDDGRTWSTPWIIDDPSVYYIPKGWTLADVRRFNAEQADAQQAGAELADFEESSNREDEFLERESAGAKFTVVPASATLPVVPREKPFVLRR